MDVFLAICGLRAVFSSRGGAILMLIFFGGLSGLSFLTSGIQLSLLNGIALAACLCSVRTLKARKE